MLSIDGIIGELLLRHNCVILPGFGGFIAQRQPARIDYHSGTMHPPGKSILFNRQLIKAQFMFRTRPFFQFVA